ncbi:MAG: 2-oxoacid:acceptor oxidoreductase family protein [Clostridiales bacterium]|nr:2-oxoacid:acceptor oxidoreductase family protein [Clostridiales bacterium]
MMTQQIIIAGFGGQGIMSLGQMLCYSGMQEGKEVSWLPSYGPEMRGGTANCHVIISDEPVASPIVSIADVVMAMNLPSLDKFEERIKPGGKLFINSSLISKKATRTDIDVYYIQANDIANELGNSRIAGMVMLGAYLKLSTIVKPESIIESLKKVLGKKKEKLIPINVQALQRGMELV